jgi:hypothetical protein
LPDGNLSTKENNFNHAQKIALFSVLQTPNSEKFQHIHFGSKIFTNIL